MLKSTSDILVALPRQLLEGRLDEIADQFALPMLVQVRDKTLTIVSREHALDVLARYRQRLLDAGVVATATRVVNQQPLTSHFELKTMHAVHLDCSGRELDEGIVRYCIGRGPRGASIEVIQYIRAPLGLSLEDVQPVAALA